MDLHNKFLKHKDDIFGLVTSALVYAIMLPLIIAEHKRIEPRYIDLDFAFIHLKQMPMVLYILILTVMLATTVNFFRDILSTAKKYFDTRIGYPQQNSFQTDYTTPNYQGSFYNPIISKPISSIDSPIPPGIGSTNADLFGGR